MILLSFLLAAVTLVQQSNGFIVNDRLFITMRQCRWSPHTARGENGQTRQVTDLGASSMSEMFAYDDAQDWADFTDSPRKLRANNLLPKWIFRNTGVQPLVAAILMVDKVSLDREKPDSVLYLTPWNILHCGVYKFHSNRNLYDLIITNVLEEENKLGDLIDIVYRLGLCVVNDMKDSCPTDCEADEALVTNCTNVDNVKLGVAVNCFTEVEADLDFQPFGGAELERLIKFEDFERELPQFQDWHSKLATHKRIPSEIFEENLRSHKLVLFVITELLADDPDEKPVTMDDQYSTLRAKYIASGCFRDDAEVHKQKECFRFRALLHIRLVALQKQLVAKRNCICSLGYRWDPEREVCQKRLLGYCHEQEVCRNGGICEAQKENSTQMTSLNIPVERISIKCICPPAWQGDRCELERDVCQIMASTSTCGDHICLRDPDVELGFSCICPPETHVRISDKDPRCRDINECTERNPELNPLCKNDGVCENHNPGFICKCRHGFGGPRCEFPPDPPTWSSWEEWSKCILPDKALACLESPMQVRIRRCISKGVAQHCEGPRREIRFLCPGQMNNWDTLACSRYRGNITHRNLTGYSRLDYMPTEEFGKFSSHELELLLRDSFSGYMWHCGLLTCSFAYCLLTPVAIGWCLWRVLLSRTIAGRLSDSSVAASKAKQCQLAREEAETEAAELRRKAAEAQARINRRRTAKRIEAETLELWSRNQLEEASWQLAADQDQLDQLREAQEQKRQLELRKLKVLLKKRAMGEKLPADGLRKRRRAQQQQQQPVEEDPEKAGQLSGAEESENEEKQK